MSGRHADVSTATWRSSALLAGATLLGLWFGLRAPDVTPVALPPTAVQVQPADAVTPVVPITPGVPVAPQQADGRGPRGGDR